MAMLWNTDGDAVEGGEGFVLCVLVDGLSASSASCAATVLAAPYKPGNFREGFPTVSIYIMAFLFLFCFDGAVVPSAFFLFLCGRR